MVGGVIGGERRVRLGMLMLAGCGVNWPLGDGERDISGVWHCLYRVGVLPVCKGGLERSSVSELEEEVSEEVVQEFEARWAVRFLKGRRWLEKAFS